MNKITTTKDKKLEVDKHELRRISQEAKNNKVVIEKSIKPFNMIVVGMTACGKTKFLLEFI